MDGHDDACRQKRGELGCWLSLPTHIPALSLSLLDDEAHASLHHGDAIDWSGGHGPKQYPERSSVSLLQGIPAPALVYLRYWHFGRSSVYTPV